MAAVVQAAISTGCTAVHPGYGFLSERPAFAELCAENGIIFVGPFAGGAAGARRQTDARALAESVGVPVSAGGTAQSPEEVRELAESIGYPVLIKAAHGGGGRGMKLVSPPPSWPKPGSGLGRGRVVLRRRHRLPGALRHRRQARRGPDPRRPPRQPGTSRRTRMFGAVPLPESGGGGALRGAARRHPGPAARQRLQIAEALDYVGWARWSSSTTSTGDELAFLEVNPRLQVEHPVTEAVTGVDLVREQLLVALGNRCPSPRTTSRLTGHAIDAGSPPRTRPRSCAPRPDR